MKLGSLTHPSARRALDRGAIALLPVGATEAHGPHLPLDTDVRIAEETCRRALPLIASRLHADGIILPPIAYSVTEYAAPFEGTIGISPSTAKAFLTEVLVGAARQGFRAVVLVNAHLEPAHRHVLRDAAEAARAAAPCPILIADPADRRWVARFTAEFRSGKCHAGQYETSLVLAEGGPLDHLSFCDLPAVDIDLVGGMKAGQTTFPEMGANEAYFGAPAEASAAEGHDTYRRLAEVVVEVLEEGLTSAKVAAPGKTQP